MTLLHLPEDKLSRITYHEVFLVYSKEVTCLIRIIRIQEKGEVLKNILLVKIYTLLYDALINSLKVE